MENLELSFRNNSFLSGIDFAHPTCPVAKLSSLTYTAIEDETI